MSSGRSQRAQRPPETVADRCGPGRPISSPSRRRAACGCLRGQAATNRRSRRSHRSRRAIFAGRSRRPNQTLRACWPHRTRRTGRTCWACRACVAFRSDRSGVTLGPGRSHRANISLRAHGSSVTFRAAGTGWPDIPSWTLRSRITLRAGRANRTNWTRWTLRSSRAVGPRRTSGARRALRPSRTNVTLRPDSAGVALGSRHGLNIRNIGLGGTTHQVDKCAAADCIEHNENDEKNECADDAWHDLVLPPTTIHVPSPFGESLTQASSTRTTLCWIVRVGTN